MAHLISKSLYVIGLQCDKALFMEKYQRDLKVISAQTQTLFDQGTLVGDTARDLFPGGVLIPYVTGKGGREEMVSLTQEAMDNGATVIYEAAFIYGNAFAKADILVKGEFGWELYEVKSGTEAAPEYLEDVAFQYHVITSAGLNVSVARLAYINTGYVRQGALEVDKLFICQDVTDFAVKRRDFVIGELQRQQSILDNRTIAPSACIGKRCKTPYDCSYRHHCWQDVPKNSVFDLRERGIDKDDFYKQGIVSQDQFVGSALLHLGKDANGNEVANLADIAVLNKKQRQQVDATRNKENFVDMTAVRNHLKEYTYPLCFWDVESFISPIPLYDGQKPYQQTPFQYSLHIIREEGAAVEHYGFLAEPNCDPRESFALSFLAHMPGAEEAPCIVAYNQSFEVGILKGLAGYLPHLALRISPFLDRFVDLMVPFRKRDVYFWRMKGSYSIKATLPALVPHLSYKGMEVSNGYAAMQAYFAMCELAVGNDAAKRAKIATIRRNLTEYCGLDTFGMVELWEALRFLVTVGLEEFVAQLDVSEDAEDVEDEAA